MDWLNIREFLLDSIKFIIAITIFLILFLYVISITQVVGNSMSPTLKLAVYYKKIHMFPYTSISSCAINFKPGKVELLFSFDSGYQLHINFLEMDHNKKEVIKAVYKQMMNCKL